jgi:hypothetical protein
MGSSAIFAGSRTKFLTAGGIELPNRTTAQRNALTPVSGQTIFNSDTDAVEYWDGASWKSLSQFNLADRNYFSDGNAQDIAKFTLYNDGGAVPTDGTGGSVSANLTKSLNTSTPIIGTSSYRMSKAGSVNLQGQGASITTDIALDAPVTEGQPLTVQFRYRTSASFAAGDVAMFVYLVGPNTVQALNGIRNDGTFTNQLGATGGSVGQFTASTNATATTTAVRLIAHIAATTTTNWDLDVDEITIGTAAQLISVEKRSETLNLTGSGDFTGGTVQVAKVGNLVTVAVLTSLTHASSATPVSASGVVPTWARPSSEKRNQYQGTNEFYVTSAGLIGFARAGAATSSGTTPNVSYTVDETSNIISSTQAQFLTQRGSVTKTATQSIPDVSETKITFPIVIENQFGLWDSTNNRFVFTKRGRFAVFAEVSFGNVAAGSRYATIKKNGSAQLALDSRASGGTAINTFINLSCDETFVVGDFVEVFGWQNSGAPLNTQNPCKFSVVEIPDLSVVGLLGALPTRTQTKALTTVVSGITTTPVTITALTFNNLVTGRRYKVYAQFYGESTTANARLIVRALNGSTILATANEQNSYAAGQRLVHLNFDRTFTAGSTTVTFTATGDVGTWAINGNTEFFTYSSLEELPNNAETTEWT